MPFTPGVAPASELLEALRGSTFRARVHVFEDEAKTKPLEGLGSLWTPKLEIAGYINLVMGAGLAVSGLGALLVTLLPSQTRNAPAAQLHYLLSLTEVGNPEEVVFPLRGTFLFIKP